MKELEKNELMEVEGGKMPKIPGPIGWLIGASIYIYDNWDDITKGYDSYQTRYIGKE